jgi:transcriptional regulator
MVRKLSEDELAAQIDALSAKFEGWLAPKQPWTAAKVTSARLEMLKKAIVGFVMTIDEVEGSFKLNQHKSDADYTAIANALSAQSDAGSRQIAGLMRETRPQAFAAQAEGAKP